MDVPKVLRPKTKGSERSLERDRPRVRRPRALRHRGREEHGQVVGKDVGRSVRPRHHEGHQRSKSRSKVEI